MIGKNKIVITLLLLSVFSAPTATASDILQPVERPDGLDKRAEEVYGSKYKFISSWSCYELCVGTATTEEQQVHDIIYTLSRRGGYVSEGEVVTNVPAGSLDELPMERLIESGVVEIRTEDEWPNRRQFKYTGDQERPSRLTDAEVRERVHRRLYLSLTSMEAQAIADNLPVGVDRVKAALQTLEANNKVDGGYDGPGFIESYEWVDTRHGTLPDWRFRQLRSLGPIVAAIGAAGYAFFRRSQTPEEPGRSDS